MTGIDSNVLVRLLVEDAPDQTDRVHRFLAKSRAAGETVYVSTVVLCESAWVLRSVYARSKSQILDAFEQLLGVDVMQVEEEDAVRSAVQLSRTGKADFADSLIGQLNLAHGCRRTVTFDRSLRTVPGFAVL